MTDAEDFPNLLPRYVSIPLLGALGGLSRSLAYELARRPGVHTVLVRNNLMVPIAEAEGLLGRPITAISLALALRHLEDRAFRSLAHPAIPTTAALGGPVKDNDHAIAARAARRHA